MNIRDSMIQYQLFLIYEYHTWLCYWLETDQSRQRLKYEQEIFLFFKVHRTAMGSTPIIQQELMAVFLGCSMQLTAHSHLVPRLRTSAATQPDLHMLSVHAYGQFCLPIWNTHNGSMGLFSRKVSRCVLLNIKECMCVRMETPINSYLYLLDKASAEWQKQVDMSHHSYVSAEN